MSKIARKIKDMFFTNVKRNFITGLVILVPVVTTIYVVTLLFIKLDAIFPKLAGTVLPFLPKEWIPGIGILLLIVGIYFVGSMAKKQIVSWYIGVGNFVMERIPLANKFYGSVQQVVDAFVKGGKQLFSKAVLIEYPKPGSYCIAFKTGDAAEELIVKTGKQLVCVFVPTTPNPTSGFLLYIPRQDVIFLDMDIETAVKVVMSAGVVNPKEIKETQKVSIKDLGEFINAMKKAGRDYQTKINSHK